MDSDRRISFLQINIYGLSNHCKLALETYSEKQKQDVVFLNETKTEVPETAFTNYTALRSTSNEMAGGVALIFRYNVAFAQLKELETKDNDNAVAAANVRGQNSLPTTACRKLRKKVNLLNSKTDLKHVNLTQIKTTWKMFFSLETAMPGIIIGATRNATNFEMNYQVYYPRFLF